jgi:integrase
MSVSSHIRSPRRDDGLCPIPPAVVDMLRQHCQDYPPGADGLIFTAKTGAALKRGTFRARVWKPSLHRAGLPTTLRFHDLRHSYATWLVSEGVPINDVARVMGHEQTSTTLDRYAHSTRDRDRRVLAAFDAFSLPLGESAAPRDRTAPPRRGADLR